MFKKVSNIVAIILTALFVNQFSLYANGPSTPNHNVHHIVKQQTTHKEETETSSSTDSYLIIFILCLVIVVFYFKYLLPQKQKRDFFTKIRELIEEHKVALSVERDRVITRDAYGNVFDDKWKKKEIPHFIEYVIKKRLSERELDILEDEKNEVIAMIDISAKDRTQLIVQEFNYDPTFGGIQYEEYCKNILRKKGWDIQSNSKNSDKGVDIIACKNEVKVAIQCKHYNYNVGIGAVQEIFSGTKYYSAQYGVVVSNISYTRAAQELAKTTGIKLLHHNELLKDDFYK